MADKPRLYPEDQERVNQYLRSGYNETERKPFRPFRLMLFLLLIVSGFSVFSILLARLGGVY